jgi:O-antigen/teichoic acid export membrane protein
LVNVATGICGAILDMTGNTKLKLLNSLVSVGATLGLNLLLIPRWGLLGAAIAALAAAIMVNLLRLVEVFILFRLLPYNMNFIKPVTAGLIAVAVSTLLHSIHTIDMGLFTAMNALILLAVYGGIIFLLGISPEDHLILNRIWQRLRKGQVKSIM